MYVRMYKVYGRVYTVYVRLMYKVYGRVYTVYVRMYKLYR